MVSALLTESGPAAELLNVWIAKEVALVTSGTQLDELAAVTRRAVVRPLITPSVAGRFINDLRNTALVLEQLPHVDRSADPGDNFLLAMAEAADADYLVTGAKRHVLALERHGRTQIVSVRKMLSVLAKR